jgi:hypothetical protein
MEYKEFEVEFYHYSDTIEVLDPVVFTSELKKVYYYNGVKHREDGPACISTWGDKEWWYNGTLHRQDGPAIEYSHGRIEWWKHNKRHREDGPAIMSERILHWYKDGQVHREDGPAIIEKNIEGNVIMHCWCVQSKYHRIDGPAIEYFDITKLKSYYILGIHIKNEKSYYKCISIWKKYIKKIKERIRIKFYNLLLIYTNMSDDMSKSIVKYVI